jgi:hypothetical protein
MTFIQFDDEPDQEERVKRLRAELEKIGGAVADRPEFLTAEMEETVLRQILECETQYETAEPHSLLELLLCAGLEIPPPDQLDDNNLALKLKQIIDRIASLKAYLIYTNHLSDRELYERLYNDTLPDKSPLLSMNCAYVIDCSNCANGSYEGRQVFLQYYADDEQRQQWADDWPDAPMPEHEDPPFDRDRFLPQSPLG